MKKFCSIFSATTLTLIAGTTYATCFPVSGVVTSVPSDFENCLGIAERFSDQGVNTDTPLGACFQVRGRGAPGVEFEGFSEFTSVVAASAVPNGGVAATPLTFAFTDITRANLLGFTSQAALTGKIRNLRGTILTKDTGYIAALDPSVTDILQAEEQIVGQVLNIVGGEGDFADAYGAIGVAGEELGGFAQFTGQICVPD